ncbi:unnamed protein product [Durusdinium trenchii]|uniref:Sodium channel protein type 11 subunit alpha (NaN) (Sensory neuron sodium channel 2) (Sodium channel protein type XI subunit alpha) (Voltage-gated sodium channel subunit alpha Nav1.9) n=2 Tax=Durusdinium trenchii TaxID=1381693 RepID=A0ABP0IWI8_9DINO
MGDDSMAAQICERVVHEMRETLSGHHAELVRICEEMNVELSALKSLAAEPRLEAVRSDELPSLGEGAKIPGRQVRVLAPAAPALVLPHEVHYDAVEGMASGKPEPPEPVKVVRKSNKSNKSENSQARARPSGKSGQSAGFEESVIPNGTTDKSRARKSRWWVPDQEKNMKHRQAYRKVTVQQMSNVGRIQKLHLQLKLLLNSHWFELGSMLLIISNVVFCGIEVELLSGDPSLETQRSLDIAGVMYNVIFLIEFLLLVVGNGVKEHFTNAEWAWHVFDAVVVFFGVVEVILYCLQSGGNFSAEYVRVVRLVKIFRVLRVVRVLRALRGLRLLLLSLVHTIRSLVWTLSLLLVILWFFGIVFTTAANEHGSDEHGSEQSVLLEKYYGSLAKTIFTLFKCSCNGMDWYDAVEVLEHLDQAWLWVGFFLCYICFNYFALLNIITGVFCHSAITGAFKNEDVVFDELQVHKGIQARRLMELWDLMDLEGFGSLDASRFAEAFEDEAIPLGLEVLGIKELWRMDGSFGRTCRETHRNGTEPTGSRPVFPERFVEVGLCIQGEAKALDVALLRQEFNGQAAGRSLTSSTPPRQVG